MFTRSLWNSFSGLTQFPTLNNNIAVDVAIIGGGITGITTAMLLKRTGLKVAVLEAKEVGKGTTGHSTGNLYVITDQLLSPIKKKYDIDVLKQVVRARGEAFKLIEDNVQEFDMDCDYKKQPMYVSEDEETNKIDKELEIAREGGIPFSEISGEFPFELSKGMVIRDQANFNPLLYVQQLANKILGDNCGIYENTRVKEIEEGENEVLINTTSGKVVAKYVVHATHTPKGVQVQYHTTLGPYREYGVAVKISGSYPEGIFWGYHKSEKYSVRSYTRNGENFLLCIGKPHKVGQAEDNEQHIKDLITFLKTRFDVLEVTHSWGGQHYKPADHLPYIGRKNDGSKQFVATGFATDGLVYGTLSAILISDEISGKANEFNDLFKASRHQPVKAAGEFIKENIDVAVEFVKGWLSSDDKELREINPGEARVIQKDGHKAAVYRDKEGKLSITSAVCTHMGCVVHWNNAEETWDCPCHGSRFDPAGDVIEGPAIDPLKKLNETLDKL